MYIHMPIHTHITCIQNMYMYISIYVHMLICSHVWAYTWVCMSIYTCYMHKHVVIDECMYVHMYVYMLYGCIHLGMYIGRHK